MGSLNASRDLLTYNTQPDEEKGTGSISSVLKSATAQKYIQSKSFSIIKGDLIYASQNAKELEWAQEVGLGINPYNIDENGVLLSSETNLMLMDEVTGTVVIPEMVTAIGEGTFAYIKGLKRVVIPPNVKEIGTNAFRGNTEIEEVVIQLSEDGSGLQRILERAFSGCTGLKTFSIPDSVVYIGDSAFSSCTGLQDIRLSKNANLIGGTFAACTQLQAVIIPEGVEHIGGWGTFYACSALKTVHIPSTMKNISSTCFDSCVNIQNITLVENGSNFIFENGILLSKDRRQLLVVTRSAIEGSDVFSIPEGVVEIPGRILLYGSLRKIIIPASVTQLDGNSFSSNVSEIEIDENNPKYAIYNGNVCSKDNRILYMCVNKNRVVNVDDGIQTAQPFAFKLCSNAVTIVFPDSFTTLDKQTFLDSGVVNVKFGRGLEKISLAAFDDNNSIKNVEISSENAKYTAEDGVIYNKDKTELIRVVKKEFEKFVVPNTVIHIGGGAFAQTSALKTVELPNSVKTIGYHAFGGSGIISIYIPESVETIEELAFNNANKLEEVRINKKKGSISGAPWRAPIGDRAIKWLKE